MRTLLLDNVVRAIVLYEDANTVSCAVGNETNEPISGVQLTVRPQDGLLVYTSPPSAEDLPPRPRWEEPLDQMRADAIASALRYQVPDFYPYAGSVEEKGDAFDVTWDKPGQSHTVKRGR